MRSMTLALVLVAACGSASHATQSPRPTPIASAPMPNVKDLSTDLEPFRVAGKLPALGAAVFRGSELVAIGATGFRKDGDAARVTTNDAWHLGSDTKAMTAVLVSITIDRGKLHFEDTLGAIFGAGVHADLAHVTIEALLGHRAGFGDTPLDIFMEMRRDTKDPKARERATAAILARAPDHVPGKFVYSNSSYIVLGSALERVTGKSWEELMRADLFAPLGMTHCGFGSPMGDAPWGHRTDGDKALSVEPGPLADNPPALGPAGTVNCTLGDWGKFLGVILAGARGEKTIATAETMKRLLTPPEGSTDRDRYAGGWMFLSRPWGGGTVLTHSGSNTMWTATAWLAPEKNLAFAVVTNRFDPRAADAAFGAIIPPYTK